VSRLLSFVVRSAGKLRGIIVPSRTRRSAAIYGVVIAHVMVFIPAFLIGAIGGAVAPMDMSSGPPASFGYGIKGGTNGIGWVLFFYIVTFGTIPLVVSVIGAVLGLGVGWFLRHLSAEKQNTNGDPQAALRRLAQKWGKAEPGAAADRQRE
jgi:hypothetical protein